ncbi:response regulator [Algibacter pectinivorans]|uniref:Response regulator receiver domain-containing protein n=1 Tax=Algibacter pectinivorans TaxID=870482 RepID=A0A1I1QUC0_9FLAO|nr:response regulator [Algibacter pectinivorans]SFD25744.1 Response regulator receiver domain-containing protein [Algibacter pectinivorans]
MSDKRKIKILFIDDDKATNFLNKHLAKGYGDIESIYLKHSGFEAMEFLENCCNNCENIPNLIFLDINMPAMNGWEFLEEFYNLDEKVVNQIKVIILSSSDDPGDIKRFESNDRLLDFIRKPLNAQTLGSVIQKI